MSTEPQDDDEFGFKFGFKIDLTLEDPQGTNSEKKIYTQTLGLEPYVLLTFEAAETDGEKTLILKLRANELDAEELLEFLEMIVDGLKENVNPKGHVITPEATDG